MARQGYAGHRAAIWSCIGSLLGITAVAALGKLERLSVGDTGLLVGSFGAAVVLLFAAPQSPLAQPRNLMGGQVLSALVGVLVFQLVPIDWLAPGLAVSLAIGCMHLTCTLHPPGGATALIAVIGGESLHELGYWYALSPIALGSAVLLIVALGIGRLSGQPYPASAIGSSPQQEHHKQQ